MGEPEAAPLRVTADQRRVDDWALALASAGIDSRIDRSADGYALVVRPSEWEHADRVLIAFDAENRPRPAPPQEPPEAGMSPAAIVAALLLCAFFVVTGPRDRGAAWFEHGAATALRINDGELWRTVTALTLHADFPHILSNAATLMVFGTALCGVLGGGVGIWVLLLSGATGNWLNAALRGAGHSAVGASTAVFGGVGALAAIQLIRRRRGAPMSAWTAWAPVAGGLALLGFLGTAPQTDVLAHLFGFAAGGLLGIMAFPTAVWRNRQGLQLALSLAAAALVAASWIAAFTAR
jgi:membrane associated rhomboid family serine protease